MMSARKRGRMLRNLMVAAACLGAYYFGVYRPLSNGAMALDRPLTTTWRQLLESSPHAVGLDADYGDRVKLGLNQARDATAALESIRRELSSRLDLDPVVRERMERPFQLIEFQTERQVRLEELGRMAAERKIGLGAGVAAGFPEYTAGRWYPTLLWPQLAFTHHLVATALYSGVSTVSVVRLGMVQAPTVPTNAPGNLLEIPIDVELEGAGPSVGRFLESLPLRADELKARGILLPATNKPVLFIRGFVLRKASREQPDWVRLALSASGFVPATPGIGAEQGP